MAAFTEAQINELLDDLKRIRAQEHALVDLLRTKGALTEEQITELAADTTKSLRDKQARSAFTAEQVEILKYELRALLFMFETVSLSMDQDWEEATALLNVLIKKGVVTLDEVDEEFEKIEREEGHNRYSVPPLDEALSRRWRLIRNLQEAWRDFGHVFPDAEGDVESACESENKE